MSTHRNRQAWDALLTAEQRRALKAGESWSAPHPELPGRFVLLYRCDACPHWHASPSHIELSAFKKELFVQNIRELAVEVEMRENARSRQAIIEEVGQDALDLMKRTVREDVVSRFHTEHFAPDEYREGFLEVIRNGEINYYRFMQDTGLDPLGLAGVPGLSRGGVQLHASMKLVQLGSSTAVQA